MRLNGVVQLCLTVCSWCLWVSSSLGQAQSPPNIIVILVDDLGYGDIGPYGATLQKTPALDRMASEGLRLTSFYSAPVCSVARAQLLTGCYGARVSVPGVYFPGGGQGLNPAEKTVAEYLRERGYRTACFGKWHLGDQPEFLPLQQGFDRYLGIPYSNDMQRRAKGGADPVVPLLRDNAVDRLLRDADQSEITQLYTEEALRFIRESGEQPFFCICRTPQCILRSGQEPPSAVVRATVVLVTGWRKWTGVWGRFWTSCGGGSWIAGRWCCLPATMVRG